MKCIISSNNWIHRRTDKRFKEKFERPNRKPFSRFIIKDSYICSITRNKKSTSVCDWNLEREVSPLFKEKYQRNKTRDMRQQQKQQQQHNNNNNNNNNNNKLSGLE